MSFIKHRLSLTVKNLDFNKGEVKIKRHGTLLPNSIRSIICGPSNCGKTNLLISLIEDPNGLRFENVYIFSKSLHQPKYKLLTNMLGLINKLGLYTFTNNSDVPAPNAVKPNSIMIFDDVACGKQDNIRAYFCMGRHNSIDSFYLCQSYTHVPKHLIRDNANLIIIFRQDDMNLRHIYSDHLNNDLTFEEFHNICKSCWTAKYGFVVIDKDSPLNNGRIRRGFDEFYKADDDDDGGI